MSTKTPVSALQETCQKHYCEPKYELIVNGEWGPDNTRVFKYAVSAFNMLVYGEGTSKQLAKHDGAEKCLHKLKECENMNVYGKPVSLPPRKENDVDFVSKLTNKCIVNNWPIPSFDLINSTGPPHNPEFTMTCNINKYTTEGKCNTKKGAQRRAAEAVLILLEEQEKSNLPVIEEFVLPTIDEVLFKYRKITKRKQKRLDGKKVRIMDRHRYFESFSDDKIDIAKKILCGLDKCEELTAHEKVHLVLDHFGISYELSKIKQMNVFELLGDYDCVFVGYPEVPWIDIVNYLKMMLNIKLI